MAAAKTKRAGFSGDHPVVGVIVAIMLLAAVCGSFGLSAHGLWMLAGDMGVEGAARALLVITIDGLIVGTTGAIIIRRGRKESSWFLWFVVALMTVISAWANFSAHHAAGQEFAPSLVGAIMPLVLLLATEVTLMVLVRTADETPDRKPKRTKTAPATVASAPAPAVAAPAPAPSRTPARPRPAAVAASGVMELPFDEVQDAPEETLLADLHRLAQDPESSEARTPQSAQLTATIWALVERHGHSLAELARTSGEVSADRFKYRLKNARSKAPATTLVA